MRIFLVAWLICQIEAVDDFIGSQKSYNRQIFVEAASYPSSFKRILRSSQTFPAYNRPLRSRVFRNVQHIASFSSDEPRLYRASGRFTKRAQAVPTHELAIQKPESVQIVSYNYEGDKHHVNKLLEDNMTMPEASEMARGMERTTVAVKTEDVIIQRTTPIPIQTTPTIFKAPPVVSSITDEKHEFKQPPPAFVQRNLLTRPGPSPTRTFSQTVVGQATNNQGSAIPSRINMGGIGGIPPLAPPQPSPLQQAGQLFLPVPQINSPSEVKDINSQSALPPQLPPPIQPLPALPNLAPPMLPPPVPPNLPNNLVPNNLANGIGSPITSPMAPPPPPPPPPHLPENRFEVINGQAANSSLEQLGCSFDWLTNSCKDLFALGWCGRCHDFGNIFLHDCKCIHPLVPVPQRQQSPRPALFWLFN
ncbi:unnamed protein product [Auanema sp. JU1783]|nr:unnamed protein product [Auanema sp. JU1783]